MLNDRYSSPYSNNANVQTTPLQFYSRRDYPAKPWSENCLLARDAVRFASLPPFRSVVLLLSSVKCKACTHFYRSYTGNVSSNPTEGMDASSYAVNPLKRRYIYQIHGVTHYINYLHTPIKTSNLAWFPFQCSLRAQVVH